MNALHLLGCLLGLAGTGVLLVGAICFAHHRGDARMGVADTQGREDQGRHRPDDGRTRRTAGADLQPHGEDPPANESGTQEQQEPLDP